MRRAGAPLVLVVEDQDAIRKLVTDALSREGYRVDEAVDGADAIRRLDPLQPGPLPQLIILDMSLPEVDGLGVLRHLARLAAAPPVIAMSATAELLAAARAAGARATLSKPFGMGELLDFVEQYGVPCSREGGH
jgi:CheY-like chemotaxis protein